MASPPPANHKLHGYVAEMKREFSFRGLIPAEEDRSITAPQLQRIVGFVEPWSGSVSKAMGRQSQRNLFVEFTLDFYYLNEWFICPATKEHGCACVELLTDEAQPPEWFISHWWGERVANFAKCVELHVETRALPENTPFWVFAFASRPHAPPARAEAFDPYSMSFVRAMQASEGILLVVNSQQEPSGPAAAAFKRIWCLLELSVALHSSSWETPLLFDIATCHGTRAQLLTDGLTYIEQKREEKGFMGQGTVAKADRENAFPLDVIAAGLALQLEEARASAEADRTGILEWLAARGPVRGLPGTPAGMSPIPEEEAETRPPSKELPPAAEAVGATEQINIRLRASLAVAAWGQAVDKQMIDPLGLPRVLKMDAWRRTLSLVLAYSPITGKDMGVLAASLPASLRSLHLSFEGCELIDNEGVASLALAFPPTLTDLHLDFDACDRLGDSGLAALARKFSVLDSLSALRLDFTACIRIGDGGIAALGQGLPMGLLKLHIGLSRCANISDAGLAGLAHNNAIVLQELRIDFQKCEPIGCPGLMSLAANFPILVLELDFQECLEISDRGVASIGRALPRSLQKLTLSFEYCFQITDAGLSALARDFKKELLELSLNLARCSKINDEGVAALARGLPKSLRRLKLNFERCYSVRDPSVAALRRCLPGSLEELSLNVQHTGVSLERQAVCRSLESMQMWRPPTAEPLPLPAEPAESLRDSQKPKPATPALPAKPLDPAAISVEAMFHQQFPALAHAFVLPRLPHPKTRLNPSVSPRDEAATSPRPRATWSPSNQLALPRDAPQDDQKATPRKLEALPPCPAEGGFTVNTWQRHSSPTPGAAPYRHSCIAARARLGQTGLSIIEGSPRRSRGH